VIHRTPKTSSIEKALTILMAFSSHGDEMGTVELSQKLGLHPATVSRILQILRKKGFLEHIDGTRKFTFGPSLFELGKTIFRSVHPNLLNIAIPHLVSLCEEVGETVILETKSRNQMVVSYIVQGKRSLSVKPNIGDRVPFHVSPGAKAILAFSDPELAGFPDEPLQRFTPKTVMDKDVFRRQLEEAKRKGVAFSREEMVMGVNTIGAPIFDHEMKPAAAIVIAGLASRVKCRLQSPMVVSLKKTANTISNQLSRTQALESKKLSGK
jgi:IclR family transcriptional regulator, KDG regulon repressor